MNTLTAIQKYRVLWAVGILGFVGSIVYTVFFNEWIYWLISYVYFRILWFFTNGISLHRYFAHKTFKTGPLRHKFLAWVTVLGGVGSPFTWAIHHRHHHRYSDTTMDLHSPSESKIQSILGFWAIRDEEWWEKKGVKTFPRDLYKDDTVMFITNHYYKIWSLIFILGLIVIGWKFTLFFIMAPVGWNLFHGALTNCLNHTVIPGSYRNYNTADASQNHPWLNFYLLGEGLHNNHHAKPNDYNQAHYPGEFDLGAIVIKKFFAI
jgi:stearoyl-CoA desaturase (delta-9 desaturase)